MNSGSPVNGPAIPPLEPPRRRQWIGFVLVFILSSAGMAQTDLLPAILTTRDGVTYHAVTYTRHDPASVYFLHRDGAASVPLANLSPALQATLGYDRETAEATAATQSAAREKHERAVAAIRLIQWKEAERRAQLRNVKPEDIVRISGRLIEKNGRQWVVACQEPISRPSSASNHADYPSVHGVITLAYHPYFESLLINDSIDCLATASNETGGRSHFDFVEAPLASPTTGPRAFPPTLLEQILAKQRAHK